MSNERRCNCCIDIEDSICIILCGEIENGSIIDSIGAALDVKAKKAFDYPPKA